MRRILATLLALVLLVSAAAAHELWVVPNLWRAAPGQTVTVLTEVGGRFPDGDSFTTPDRIESVRLIGPGTDAILSSSYRREGDALAVDAVLPSTPGTYVALVTVKPRTTDKPAGVFNAHLMHQGLDHIRAERERRGETEAPARESYSRYGKALIRVGEGGDHAVVTRPAGARMEIVPQVDPTTLAEGARLRVRVLFEGAPLRDALVGGIYATAKVKADEWPLTERTDARGEVEFTLAPAGPWLIRAVHMVRRPGDAPAGPGAPPVEYDTYWASLTFELPSGAGDGPLDGSLTRRSGALQVSPPPGRGMLSRADPACGSSSSKTTARSPGRSAPGSPPKATRPGAPPRAKTGSSSPAGSSTI